LNWGGCMPGKTFTLLSLFVSLLFLIGFSFSSSGDYTVRKYVGTKKCRKCHKSEKQGKQYQIWAESIHAQAYETLQTEEADQICKEMGYGEKAVEAKECLQCHASGWEVDEEMWGPKFKIEDGVQCETCHGAGGDYTKLKIMKKFEVAKAKGLIDLRDNVEEFCRNCHNPDSPTFAGFNFEEMWAKIEHPLPFRHKKTKTEEQ